MEKITDENDYPSRINAMIEELRCTKERNRNLEKRLHQEQQQALSNHEQMMRLEETIRELKAQSKLKKVLGGGKEAAKPYHVSIQ